MSMTEYTAQHTIALYIRLSQEDDNIGESNSVKNQRDLLNDFVSKHPELSKSKLLYFIDDGHSGMDFNRPAVADMLEQVKKGNINCIVVKDFSRFGRNYIEVIGYLEQVFPFLDVRFLSVNDFFDSNDNKGKTAGIEVGFKALIHDLYSRDLSVKTKQGKLAKIKKGEHVGGTAPFGYTKSKTIKNAWEIDEPAAITIRKIFTLALEGVTITEIARLLNADDTPTPLTHRKNNNTLKGVANYTVIDIPLWRKSNVSRILRDERFTGKNITGKIRKGNVAYGIKKTQFMPESEWIIIPDAHEPIISQKDFDEVQSTLGPINQRKATKVNSNLFAGKLYCGHCKHALRYYKGLNPKYICYASRELGNESCLPDVVLESYVSEVIIQAIKSEIALSCKAKKQADKQSRIFSHKHESLLTELRQLSLEIERLKNHKEQLFEEYADGKLTKEQYANAKSEQSSRITKAEAKQENITIQLSQREQTVQKCSNYDMVLSHANAKEVTAEMMALIKRINIFSDNRFEVIFNFSRCLTEKMEELQ